MNKLDALKAIAEGINALIDLEIGNAIPVSEEQKQEDEPKKYKVASLAEKKAEEKEEATEEVDVDSMDYRQLKSYASEIGVKSKGTKGQLLKAVKDFLADGGEVEEEAEEKPAKKPARGVASMKAKKAEEEEVESEEVESEEEDDDSEDVFHNKNNKHRILLQPFHHQSLIYEHLFFQDEKNL